MELSNNFFIEIIAASENINQLPTLEIIKGVILQKCEELENCDFIDYVEDCYEYVLNNWDEKRIVIKDGTEIILCYNNAKCILHPFNDDSGIEPYFSYQVSDDIYVCAACLSISIYKDEYLFPKSWNQQAIDRWLSTNSKHDKVLR